MAKDKKPKTSKKAAKSPQPRAGDDPQPKMTTNAYEKEMRRLQGELVALQDWVITTGARVCIVFEGLDSAGKGGTIQRITERTSPRVFKHIALPTPNVHDLGVALGLESVDSDGVGDGADGGCAIGSSGVAVGAAAFAGAG